MRPAVTRCERARRLSIERRILKSSKHCGSKLMRYICPGHATGAYVHTFVQRAKLMKNKLRTKKKDEFLHNLYTLRATFINLCAATPGSRRQMGSMQKVTFRPAKDALSSLKRPPFAGRKVTFCKQAGILKNGGL